MLLRIEKAVWHCGQGLSQETERRSHFKQTYFAPDSAEDVVMRTC